MQHHRLPAKRVLKRIVIFHQIKHRRLDLFEREPGLHELAHQVERQQVARVKARIPRLGYRRHPEPQAIPAGIGVA